MRYFVIAPDGQKYGPADIHLLNQWISEGRLTASQIVEEQATGARIIAGSLAGLNFPLLSAPPGPESFQPGQPYQNYYARPLGMMGDGGEKDLQQAWLWAVASFICIAPLTAWLAFQAASRAQAQGNQRTQGPRTVATVALVLWILYLISQVIKVISALR